MKVFRLLLLLLFSVPVFAQKNTFESPDNTLLQKVAADAVYLLRQDYYIVDTSGKKNKKLGLKDLNYFGRLYFLAFVADGHFYVDYNINTPWWQDPNFILLSSEKKYQPFLSDLAFGKLNEKRFCKIDTLIAFDSSRRSLLNLLQEYTLIKAPDSLNGLKVYDFREAPLTDTTAWFWSASGYSISATDTLNNLNDEIKIVFETSKGKYNPSKKSFTSNRFFYNQKTISGFIFITKPSLGKVEYFLNGIILKRKGKFNFVSIIDKVSDDQQLLHAEVSTENSKLILTEIIKPAEKKEEKITPVKKKRKN